MKYSKYCQYPCCFCQGKLKQKTITTEWNYQTFKVTTFVCHGCTEPVYDITANKDLPKSRFELAYLSDTGNPAAFEIAIQGHRILLAHFINKCFISKVQEIIGFNSMGQSKITHVYKNLEVINKIPKLDMTNPDAILQKIKLLLTFS